MTPRPAVLRDAAFRTGARHSRLWGPRLEVGFFARPVAEVARALLGCIVVHQDADGTVALRIVETEAYAGRDDPASHAWRGPRPHCATLFGPPGTVYVYRSYGVHWCVNAVTAPQGHGSAVLLRAAEPVAGYTLMRRRRGEVPDTRLASGPGRLGQALGCSGAHDGRSWLQGRLAMHEGVPVEDSFVRVTPRIGITKGADALLRFVDFRSAHVSNRRV